MREDKYFIAHFGFTLSEVLITLGIIGIVAALTMPSLIANYQKKVISSQMKKFVSTFSQAYNLAIVNYGEPQGWDICSIQTNNANCTKYDGGASQYILSSVKKFDISNNIPESYKEQLQENLKNTIGGGWPNWSNIKVWALNDGSIIYNMEDWVMNNGNIATTFMVDVNGLKKPNRLGKDIFRFAQVHTELSYTLNPGFYNVNNKPLKRGLYLDGFGYFSRYNIKKEECLNKNSSPLLRGVYCTSLFQTNGWEFPDYYPWNLL